jgi:hypothetical protein
MWLPSMPRWCALMQRVTHVPVSPAALVFAAPDAVWPGSASRLTACRDSRLGAAWCMARPGSRMIMECAWGAVSWPAVCGVVAGEV